MSVLTRPPDPEPSHPLRRMPTAAELPSDDGEPMETYWHRLAMNMLCEVVEHHLRGRTDYFVGGNMFVYFAPDMTFNKDFRGPDFFLVKGGVERHKPERPSWVMLEENNRLPDLIVELASPTTGHIDRVIKKDLYATRFGTHEYFVVDPNRRTIEGWRLDPTTRRYRPITPVGERLWCEQVGGWLGWWDGAATEQTGTYPRFFADNGEPFPTYKEAAQAERDAAQAERNAAQAERDAEAAENARLRAELAALRNPPPTP